ncbi:MAG: hypothetical protein MUD00_02300, partial [Candidatus Pacebacteria bacterium]|nr:hypothetical protein [Candidatus Paceibacterota bacterium]
MTSTLSVSAQTIFGSGNTQSGNISNPIETTFDPLYVDPLFYTEPSVFVNPSNTSVSQTGNVATTTIEATTTQTVTTTANVSTGNVGCPSSIRSVSQFFTWFMCVVIKLLIPVFIAASLGLFVYGVVIYFINADNAEKRRDGSKFMLWGIVALFVMISVWA